MSNQDFGDYDTLMNASAVRERCTKIGELAMAGDANWFTVSEHNFNRCVRTVRNVCERNYPDLDIPLHSRWRHFEIEGVNLWDHYTKDFKGDPVDLARSAVDLVFVSVLLDAGAGSKWRFTDPVTGAILSRSEALAAASIELFFNHLANFHPALGWSVGPESIGNLDRHKLADALQHSDENSLVGVDGRLSLLHGLGSVLVDQSDSASTETHYTRPGNLIDECLARAKKGFIGKPVIAADAILRIVLTRFGKIWPNGYMLNGRNLGDCGYHSLLETSEPCSGIVPFHKLSQWLTYSLIEPLQWAGLKVTNLDALTALPEYRNGGLLLDTGVLIPQDAELMKSTLSVDTEAVVEWRALTVYIVDQLADKLRTDLKLTKEKLPLGSILQGGTWSAGRDLAAKIRPDGSPPLKLDIDGTIF